MGKEFDVLIIGGGPGGYVAAIRASQLGLNTALVERDQLGGVCLNWGCIPTKALLRSAEIYHLMQHADAFGLPVNSSAQPDINKIVQRSRQVADQLSKGVQHLLKKHKVTVIKGTAQLLGKMEVAVAVSAETQQKLAYGAGNTATSISHTESYKAKHIIIATGGRPRTLPHLEVDGEQVWSSREAMVPTAMPKSLVIIGSGAIGIEFASFYRTLGADVTVIEAQPQILPVEDQEISAMARKIFEKQGIKFHVNSTVTKLNRGKNEVTATVVDTTTNKEHTVTAEKVIVAIGIVANTENLGLDKTKVKLDRGHIVTNQWCATDEPNVYAIGDVAGSPWLAHKASHEAVICVEHIAKHQDVHSLSRFNIPGCTYSLPQIASVGLNEAQAIAQGYKLKIGRFPYVGNGKAIALGETEGMIKTIFAADTGELLGAHMIGAEVTELIQGFVVAKTLETTEAELMRTVFPHPTLSEMMHESVLSAFGQAIHI